jgi:nucleotide-binding universal stress UspA family protein
MEGNVPETILKTAGEKEADLIVMGTHGLTGWRRLIFGSVTERVLRSAPCPVLAVPPAGQANP